VSEWWKDRRGGVSYKTQMTGRTSGVEVEAEAEVEVEVEERFSAFAGSVVAMVVGAKECSRNVVLRT